MNLFVSNELKLMRCHDITERRLLNALFLTCRNFATFLNLSEHCNGRCPLMCLLTHTLCQHFRYLCPHILLGYKVVFCIKVYCIHISVDFALLRSTDSGNAKASTSRTSNGRSSTLFCLPFHKRK